MKIEAGMWGQLNRAQQNRLKRYGCWLCEQRLDRVLRWGCCGIWHSCTQKSMETKAQNCLNASAHKHIKYQDATP